MAPLIGLILLAVLSAAIPLNLLSRQMDSNATSYFEHMVSGSVDREVTAALDTVTAPARWDDAAHNIYGHFSSKWLDTNYNYTFQHSYVLDRHGSTLWSNSPDKYHRVLGKAAPAAMRRLLARLPKTMDDAMKQSRGVAEIGLHDGHPAILSAMAIIPWYDPAPPRGTRPLYLFMVSELNARMIDRIGETHGLADLDWAKGVYKPDQQRYDVREGGGRIIGTLQWKRTHAGQQALRQLAPITMTMALLFTLLSIWLIRQVQRSHRALRVESDRARQSAAEARRADAEAKDALDQAEMARNQAAQGALREAGEQRRHEEQMRQSSQQVADALEKSMAALVMQLLDTANEMERSADQTLSSIQAQQAQADIVTGHSRDTAQAAQAIASTIDDLTTSIGDISRAATQIHQAADAASERSSQARGANDNLLRHVGSINDAAHLIAEITGQTNLLALNATIEAARAG